MAVVLARPARALDLVAQPPERETVASPDGRYALEIFVAARPGSAALRSATGTLRHDGATVWRRALQPFPRPRFAVVDNQGRVALFGAWDADEADETIILLDPAGRTAATSGMNAAARTLGATRRDLAQAATHGTWLSAPPRIQGGEALFGAGGRMLALDMASGALRRMPD